MPPPPEFVLDCMGGLESFIHLEDTTLPLLVRAGLIHAQFETIHPFLDGNGRVGRLLITFMLCAKGVLREPVLYLSLFLRQHRQTYYEVLNGTRKDEGWTEWLDFFLQGVRDTANQATTTARRIDKLFHGDRAKVEVFGRGTATALQVYRYAQINPLFSIGSAARATETSYPTSSAAVGRLVDARILRESSGKQRDRIFEYQNYLALLNDGLEAT